MGPTLIALAISVLLTLAGAFVYSSYMGKMSTDKKAANINPADVNKAQDKASSK